MVKPPKPGSVIKDKIQILAPGTDKSIVAGAVVRIIFKGGDSIESTTNSSGYAIFTRAKPDDFPLKKIIVTSEEFPVTTLRGPIWSWPAYLYAGAGDIPKKQ
jgi:hypothetical protein